MHKEEETWEKGAAAFALIKARRLLQRLLCQP